ncbi:MULTISPECIES: carboxymuconolactone decarboxylase family protein [unclassified Beijerinckia]|uniref:(R)-mandelonitrile lyase n=1 Tax=unclassified Beijerinckia TaxID=2638183 RepID=UPI00089B2FD5|nr:MULTISPECIES: carboxymuconolactone decarboxylase family protein [unclassified Beijerinckia]MDH7795827.1 4-carboxymuconolactone decarboxylase [Beijerinckia sp. GAS462]SEC18080.1 4-carboxymuconolactone decarboxylase [Beijerinckia sp. 28-YEA-48]
MISLFAATLAALSFTSAQAQERRPSAPQVAPPEVRAVAPALAAYTDEVLFDDLWKRAELSPRDRSIVTVAALVAGTHVRQMTGHFNRALDNGVKPRELIGIITHLAFYSGWPNAMSAVSVAKDVFAQRGIGVDQLSASATGLLALDAASEAQRAAAVQGTVGPVAPALAQYTNATLFGDLWRQPDLAPRDRSLVTIAALIASGQVDQLKFHIGRGMENGLSSIQISETITHLAFYAGWPRAMSAVPVAKAVFEAQAASETRPATEKDAALEILRGGSMPLSMGTTPNFTGTVRVASRFQRNDPARVGGETVSFEPGARTAWHSHPLGQTLIVTSGCGWVQREGGPIEDIRLGDVVLIPPNVKHWHGATNSSAMTHIAIVEALNGKSTDWMEPVSDAQYGPVIKAPGKC